MDETQQLVPPEELANTAFMKNALQKEDWLLSQRDHPQRCDPNQGLKRSQAVEELDQRNDLQDRQMHLWDLDMVIGFIILFFACLFLTMGQGCLDQDSSNNSEPAAADVTDQPMKEPSEAGNGNQETFYWCGIVVGC